MNITRTAIQGNRVTNPPPLPASTEMEKALLSSILLVPDKTLALLQRESPFTRRVLTWNAEVNGHMIGVNERLGFVPVERSGEFQKRLD